MAVRRSKLAAVVTGALTASLVAFGSPALAEGEATPPAPRSVETFCQNVGDSFEPFTDVNGNFFKDNIECLALADVTRGGPGGRPTNQYGPELTVQRDAMASFIARLVDTANRLDTGRNVVELPAFDGVVDFTDPETQTNFHRQNIDRLAEVGIVTGGPGGTSPTTYGPGRPVTRAQMASFIIRALEFATTGDARSTTLGTALDFFTDDEAEGLRVHEPNINAAANEGIAVGDGRDSFTPLVNINRAQMAGFLSRALAFLQAEGDIRPLGEEAPRQTEVETATVAPGEDIVFSVEGEDIESITVSGECVETTTFEDDADPDQPGFQVGIPVAADADDGDCVLDLQISSAEGGESTQSIVVTVEDEASPSPSPSPTGSASPRPTSSPSPSPTSSPSASPTGSPNPSGGTGGGGTGGGGTGGGGTGGGGTDGGGTGGGGETTNPTQPPASPTPGMADVELATTTAVAGDAIMATVTANQPITSVTVSGDCLAPRQQPFTQPQDDQDRNSFTFSVVTDPSNPGGQCELAFVTRFDNGTTDRDVRTVTIVRPIADVALATTTAVAGDAVMATVTSETPIGSVRVTGSCVADQTGQTGQTFTQDGGQGPGFQVSVQTRPDAAEGPCDLTFVTTFSNGATDTDTLRITIVAGPRIIDAFVATDLADTTTATGTASSGDVFRLTFDDPLVAIRDGAMATQSVNGATLTLEDPDGRRAEIVCGGTVNLTDSRVTAECTVDPSDRRVLTIELLEDAVALFPVNGSLRPRFPLFIVSTSGLADDEGRQVDLAGSRDRSIDVDSTRTRSAPISPAGLLPGAGVPDFPSTPSGVGMAFLTPTAAARPIE